MLCPFAVLPKPSFIESCPRLHAPQSSEHKHGWRAHLPFPSCLPGPQKLPQRRITECPSGHAAVLTLNTKVWTPADCSSPQGELGFRPHGGFSWADTPIRPSVNPALLDSRNGIILPAQPSHTVSDTELAEENEQGILDTAGLLLRESSRERSTKVRRCTAALSLRQRVTFPSPWTSLTQPLFLCKLIITGDTAQLSIAFASLDHSENF